jgi:fermentation-respiration switch protein FrsA (DUF1100 family)
MRCEMVWKCELSLFTFDSSILLKLVVALVVILIVGWITHVITMGYQLFRRTSSRLELDPTDPLKGMSPSERDLSDEAEKIRADLMALPHESLTISKDDIELSALYFPAFSDSDQRETVNKTGSEHPSSSIFSNSAHVDKSAGKRCDNPFEGTCAVVVHGLHGHVLSRATEALQYLKAGFSVLMPALRGHRPTGGAYTDLFLNHYDDLILWIDYLKKIDAGENQKKVRAFVFDGVSMGASNVLKAAGDPNLPSSVVAVIADCGYTSLREEGRWMLHKLPFFLRFPVLATTQIIYGVLAGVWGEKPTPLDCVRHVSVPVFIIHGDSDRLVPTWMGEQLYEACASEKKSLWIVPNATHATSNEFAGSDYTVKRHHFIKEALHISTKSAPDEIELT